MFPLSMCFFLTVFYKLVTAVIWNQIIHVGEACWGMPWLPSAGETVNWTAQFYSTVKQYWARMFTLFIYIKFGCSYMNIIAPGSHYKASWSVIYSFFVTGLNDLNAFLLFYLYFPLKDLYLKTEKQKKITTLIRNIFSQVFFK